MKIAYFNRMLAAIAALLVSSHVFAATSDYLLVIEGIQGECTGKKFELTENADGSFTATNIPGGTYKLVYKAVPATQGGTAKTAVATGEHFKQIKLECVVSPRDAASGLPTGKRMHKPFIITKELDKSTPLLMLGQIVVGDLDGDGASDRKPGDPIPGLDVKLGKKGEPLDGPVRAGYDLKINKKV
jgi:hypothetical protein